MSVGDPKTDLVTLGRLLRRAPPGFFEYVAELATTLATRGVGTIHSGPSLLGGHVKVLTPSLHVPDASESKQIADVARACLEYLSRPFDEIKNYGVHSSAHWSKFISYQYINRKLASAAAFRHDAGGATLAMRSALARLLDEGAIREVSLDQIRSMGFNGQYFAVSDAEKLRALSVPPRI